MPEPLIEKARRASAVTRRDIAQFLSELHRRLEEATRLEKELREQNESAGRPRSSPWREQWEDRESAKLKELERRCDLVLEKFEAQARETIERIVAGAAQEDRRRGAAPGRQAKRELREEIETTVLSTRDESRQGELQRPKITEGVRVRLKGVREPARVRRILAGDLIEVEAGFMKLQVSIDDVLEVLPDGRGRGAAEACSFDAAPLRRGVDAGTQPDRPARRGSLRAGGEVPGQRGAGRRRAASESSTATGWGSCAAPSPSFWRSTPTWRSSTPPNRTRAARERPSSS